MSSSSRYNDADDAERARIDAAIKATEDALAAKRREDAEREAAKDK